MKLFKRFFYLFISIIFALVLPVSANEFHKILLTSYEYPPYFGKELKDNGFITQIIKEAFERVNYDVTVLFLPFNRAMAECKKGEANGIFTLWYRKEREKDFVFSDSLPCNEIGFFKRKDKIINYKEINDLKPYKIGVCRGYANPPEFKEANLTIELTENDLSNLRKLIFGRVDLILIDRVLAIYLINTKLFENKNDLVWLLPPIREDEQFLVISKKVKNYQKLIKEFNIGLKIIKEDGSFKKIIEFHGF